MSHNEYFVFRLGNNRLTRLIDYGILVFIVISFFHQLDTDLYLFINKSMHSPALDFVMRTLSNGLLGWGLLATATLALVLTRKWTAVRVAAVVLAAVVVTDVLCYRVIKPTVQRTRPCFHNDTRLVVDSCGTPYTFPSNHAANAMAAATVLGLYFPLYAPLTVFIAFLVGFSRIYVGVHYPFDVLGGFVVGMLCAAFVFTLSRRLPDRWQRA